MDLNAPTLKLFSLASTFLGVCEGVGCVPLSSPLSRAHCSCALELQHLMYSVHLPYRNRRRFLLEKNTGIKIKKLFLNVAILGARASWFQLHFSIVYGRAGKATFGVSLH